MNSVHQIDVLARIEGDKRSDYESFGFVDSAVGWAEEATISARANPFEVPCVSSSNRRLSVLFR
jgi:hypothetical protein